MYFVSFCRPSRFIDRFALCVLFRRAMWAHQFTVTLTCTNANETVAIDVLVVVYNKTWENRVMLSLHGQLVLDIRPRCWLRMLKLTRLRLVNFYHPQSTSLPNIQHYLIMTRWITLQYNHLWWHTHIRRWHVSYNHLFPYLSCIFPQSTTVIHWVLFLMKVDHLYHRSQA